MLQTTLQGRDSTKLSEFLIPLDFKFLFPFPFPSLFYARFSISVNYLSGLLAVLAASASARVWFA